MPKQLKPPPLSGVHVLEWGGQEAAIAGRILAGLGAQVWMLETPNGHPLREQEITGTHCAFRSGELTLAFLSSGKRALAAPMRENEFRGWLLRVLPAIDATVTSPSAHFRPQHEETLKEAMRLVSRGVWIRVDPYEREPSGTPQTSFAGKDDATLVEAKTLLTGVRAAASCLLGLLQHGAVYDEAIESQEVLGQLLELLFGNAQVQAGYWDKGFALLPTRNGWISATILGNWSALAHAIYDAGGPSWIVNQNLDDPEARYLRSQEIFEVVARWCKTQTSAALTRWAQLRRIPFAAVRSPIRLAADSHLQRRKFFLQQSSGSAVATLRYPRVPILLKGCDFPKATRATSASALQPMFANRRHRLYGREHPSATAKPLHGVKIIDFTHAIAGPLATWLLTRYGAEVIKVDPPGLAQQRGRIRDKPFARLRAGKKSVVVGAETSQGRALLLDLTREADVIIDNFSVRVMKNWSLDYPHLRAIKPDIIQVRVTGFGLTGPLRHWVAFAHTLHAWSGHTWLRGQPTSKNTLCDGWHIPYADLASGFFAFLAVLVALWHKHRSGSGTLVDVSEYECAAFALGPILLSVANPHLWADHVEGLQQCAFTSAAKATAHLL